MGMLSMNMLTTAGQSGLDINAAGYEMPRRGWKEVEHSPVQCAQCAVYEETD